MSHFKIMLRNDHFAFGKKHILFPNNVVNCIFDLMFKQKKSMTVCECVTVVVAIKLHFRQDEEEIKGN